MRMDNGHIPTDSQLMSGEIRNAFVIAPRGTESYELPPLSHEQLVAEIKKKDSEEQEWWKGKLVDCLLTVELPFRLMLPDGEIEITYGDCTKTATIRSDFQEISHGPYFLNSHANVASIGPSASVCALDLKSLVPNNMPVFRAMRTTVLFNASAMADAFVACSPSTPLNSSDLSQMRRLSRSTQYFDSLAFSHIPFVNSLITAYRSASFDPCAFEVTEWDVPVWYVEDGTHLVRVGLMPYWDSDEPFADSSFESREEAPSKPFHAATLDEIKLQLAKGVTPGKHELLDALSLSYRGRYGDAVRSVVTSIEVSLESRLQKLLQSKGMSDENVKIRLDETRNSFFDRMNEYERLSQRRIPGPILSIIPYINGVRLRGELDSVRKLRHKIVHEGIRVDVHERGPMLRAIETMTWLFEWLNQGDETGHQNTHNYAFFSAFRGMRMYPFDYRSDGVVVLPMPGDDADAPIPTSDELLASQYAESLGPENADAELFVRMSLCKLQMDCEEGPPEELNSPLMMPRFLVRLQSQLISVFCIELDGLPDIEIATRVVASALAFQRQSSKTYVPVLVVHHQKHLSPLLREADCAVPVPVEETLRACGVVVITTLDLYFLVQGCESYNWDLSAIQQLMMMPGRQGATPPSYRRVGTVKKVFPKRSAISVELAEGQSIRVGDTLGLRSKARWHEEVVESLQVEKVQTQEAHGPIRVGVGTSLRPTEVSENIAVFRRDRSAERAG